MPVHLPHAHCSPYSLAQLSLDACTPPFRAYNLEVSLLPSRAEPAGSTNPIYTAYSSFSKSDSLFICTLIPLSLQLMQLTCLPDSLNFCTRWTPRCWKSRQRVGGVSPPGDGGSSRHPALAAISPCVLKRQSLHHDTFSVGRLVNSSCC